MRIAWVASVLLLTACSGRQTPAPISNIGSTNVNYLSQNKGQLKSDSYRVQKGETLYAISFKAGIDFRQLARLNNIKKPYNIFPGQVLKLRSNGTKGSDARAKNLEITDTNQSQKNNKKTIAKENSGEYGKNQPSQKVKKLIKTDSFPTKIRKWLYPSKGSLIEGYSSKENGNNGLDFGGKAGDPIIAAADGKVVYAGGALRGYGNLIIVKHNNDYLSAYAHNQTLLVKEQEWVKAGQVIAKMGRSGTDRVKLHFEIRFRGRAVNPKKYLPKK